MAQNKGIIYLISDGTFFKIGRTKSSAQKRLKELQTGNSTELQLIYEIKVKYASKVEATLHRRYSYCKQLNEWFDLPFKTVQNFENECLLVDSNFELLEKPLF